MSVFGVDYAWGRPGVTALTKAGVKFCCRYLSRDAGKNLTRVEAASLGDAGIWLVVVWETTAQRAMGGHAAGVVDATEAARQAAALGMPPGRPIYFAVDWDATAGQQPTIHAYLDGVAEVIGRPRVGMYGGYGPISRAFNAKKITYGWQTYAWSGGKWDSRAQLQQYKNDQKINGVGLDHDRAMTADYGQWQIGRDPSTSQPPRVDTAPPWPGRVLIEREPEMHGADVLAWQRQMKARGWSIVDDGYYGSDSANICEAFQREKGLAIDRKVGEDTWAAAWSAPITP